MSNGITLTLLLVHSEREEMAYFYYPNLSLAGFLYVSTSVCYFQCGTTHWVILLSRIALGIGQFIFS